jgi:hypothetical protein
VESPVYVANRYHQRVGYLNNYGGRLASLVAETRFSEYPLGAYPWLALYQRCFEVNVSGGSIPGVLQDGLKIYFYLDPLRVEPIDVDDRLATLGAIVTIMEQLSIGNPKMPDLPSANTPAFASFIGHLQAKFVHDTDKYYGAQSWVAIYLKTQFQLYMIRTTKNYAKWGIKWNYAALKDSAEERIDFERRMTELAIWAELPQWTLMDYLPDWQPTWRT